MVIYTYTRVLLPFIYLLNQEIIHLSLDFEFFFVRPSGSSATRTASEKTALTPSRLFAEHSMYPAAFTDLANFRPSDSLIRLPVLVASLRSDWVPARTIGTVGACFRSSGTHLSRTFSNEVRDPIEKQTTNTFEFAYDNGLNRS